MPAPRRWTRNELLLAMHLYCRIPFGRQHAHAPEIVELAAALHRTPGSVAMKLNNLTSLDPEEQARGVKGLSGASDLDRQVWNEFQARWEDLALESESLWQRRVASPASPIERSSQPTNDACGFAMPSPPSHENWGEDVPTDPHPPSSPHSALKTPHPPISPAAESPTEALRLTRTRLAQSFFRRLILSTYETRCCLTGNPIPALLEAAHVVSWTAHPQHRTDPKNGLCLTRLHHAALDQGLIAFDPDNRLLLSPQLKAHLPNQSLHDNFTRYEGQPLRPPTRFPPDRTLLTHHRETIFLA